MEKLKQKRATPTNEHVTNYRGQKVMPFIIGNETFENLGTIGSLSNMTVYLTTVFHLTTITATMIVNVLSGTLDIIPLLGAFLSDSYLGRYKTLAFGSICSFLGQTVLALTAAISKMHPPKCAPSEAANCNGPTIGQFTFLLTGFGFLVIGAGGIRPSNLPFGADQFDQTCESGRKAMNSFFNWYFFSFTFAVMISLTFITYVQLKVSWAIGLAIPACLMFMSCVVFFFGSKLYVKVKPEGSPLTSLTQVLVAATKKRKLLLPENPAACLFNYVPTNSINAKLSYTDQFRFLDKSAIITNEDQINPNGSAANPWKLCSIQLVEEAKCVLRVIPIWPSAIFYNLVIRQQQYYVIFQALQLDRRFGNTSFEVPGGSYAICAMLALTLWIPVYDRILVPILPKLTGKEGGITVLQRMGIGIFLSILTMLVSALVEGKRRHLALKGAIIGYDSKGRAISSLSGMWLIPQLVLAGLAEAFYSVGQSEFYYKQFPENMRSIASGFSSLGKAMASFVNVFLMSVVRHVTRRSQGQNWLPEDLNKGKLDHFYYLIASLGVLNLVYFLLCATRYRYKGSTSGSVSTSTFA